MRVIAPRLRARNEDPDDVGLDQAPNLRFAFCQIAVGVRKRPSVLSSRFVVLR
jgi:hypothetical protein